MTALYGVPAPLLLAIALLGSLSAALGGQLLTHRVLKHEPFAAHNELGGVLIVVCASLYAVLLGFMTVVAWEHFQEAREIVVAEADASIDAWHTSVGLPAPMRERVRKDMAAYAGEMANREWELMRRGIYDPQPAMLSMDAIDATGSLIPANPGQTNAQAATLEQLGRLHDARQRRISMNDSGVSFFEWLVLLLGATCVICFCWLFDAGSQRIHTLMTSTVVVVIVSTLILLFELQYPFRSNIDVDRQPWRDAVEHIKQMRSSAMADMRM